MAVRGAFFCIVHRTWKNGNGIFNFLQRGTDWGKRDGIFSFCNAAQAGENGNGIFNFLQCGTGWGKRNIIFSFLHYGTGGEKPQGKADRQDRLFCNATQAGKWEMVANTIN